MRQFKRSALLLALVWLLMGSALATPGVVEFIGPDAGEVAGSAFAQDAEASAPESSGVEIPTATLSPEAAALPWNLTLVNSTHPVPDGWTVELQQLSGSQAVDSRIYPELQAMFDACRAEGLKPMVKTSYRTYEDQKDMLVLKYRRYRNDGASHEEAQRKALKVAAYPGYSEHQLGLAVDIDSSDTESCSNESVWNWMKRHCQEYGFIWRYPGVKTDITGISNEDWHFRYVGVEAATYIMENRLCLEEYLQQFYNVY